MDVTVTEGSEFYTGQSAGGHKTRGMEKMELGNKTIAKLAIAIATANKLIEGGEDIGPVAKEVLKTLDVLDTRVQHFKDYQPKTED